MRARIVIIFQVISQDMAQLVFTDDDQMIETKPIVIGDGSEDYLCGTWNFGGMAGATPFAHL
jgi:hypothetical protein